MFDMGEPKDRLKEARIRAGFKNATEAARRHKWSIDTYRSHENGMRGLSRKAAVKYGKQFKVSAGWLLYGEDPAQALSTKKRTTVPLVGYVGAGAEAHLFAEGQGPFEDVSAPEDATDDTVAVEIRGDSLGSFFDRWLVYYDDVRRPVTSDLLGKLCVVGLADGRTLIKKIIRGQRRGLFTLNSQFEPPIYDAIVEWAARVKRMEPR